MVKLDGKEINVTISVKNLKRFKDGLKRVGLRTAFFHIAVVIKSLRETIDTLIEELKEGDKNAQ